MKRWAPLAIIIFAGIAAIIAIQWTHISTQPSAQAILSAGADAQHELTRVPAHFDRMSDADEIAAGNALANSYASAWPLTTGHDRAEQTYITSVGTSVAAHARRKLPWRFHYIPNRSFVNAFALPGGHIFIGRGLLDLLHSEDALAAVLGHEIEHVDLRHCAERAQTEAELRNLGTLGALIGLPAEVFMAGYSKDQELEADRDGTTLAVRNGYSPAGILQLFDEFHKLEASGPHHAPRSPIDESAQLSLQTLAGYFRSHPPSTERADQIHKMMLSEHWPTPPLHPLQQI